MMVNIYQVIFLSILIALSNFSLADSANLLEKVRSFYGSAFQDIEAEYSLKKLKRTAHEPDEYDHYFTLDEYSGIRFKLEKNQITSIELISSKVAISLPYVIGDKYCSVLSKNEELEFDYNFSDGGEIYLLDTTLNIRLKFDASNYMGVILGNMDFGKNSIEICSMNLSRIEILNKSKF